MGLLKVAFGAVGSTLGDQWKEYFYCDALSNDTLVVKASKKVSKGRNGNVKGMDNIISNGSVIAVNEGQCMIIVDQGQIVEFCATPGEFVYDTSTEASLFQGDLEAGIMQSFQTIGKRIAFGGNAGKDQRVYYFNIKEVMGNLFGTTSPVPVRVVDTNIGLDVDISVRCNGEYSFKITNPLLFYQNVCGNVDDSYERANLTGLLKSELLSALQPAFARISEKGVRYSAIPAHTTELAQVLNEELSEKWGNLRGIQIVSVSINSIKASDEEEEMIRDFQKAAVLRDPNMAAATLVRAQADSMKAAASNTSAGPMMAFAGMNMANNMGGMNAANLYQMGNQMNQQPQVKAPVAQSAGWVCTNCGTTNQGKFCMECGAKKPSGALTYKCDKCGWTPADPTNPPKFCPECGDIFNEQDA